jgi:Putative bacterial sensory transduction regulator
MTAEMTRAPTAPASSHPLLDALVGFLRSDGWPIVRIDAGGIDAGQTRVETRFAGSTHVWSCVGRTFEPQGQLVFDSLLPLEVPPERQAGVAVLLMQFNWTSVTGAFAVDPESGAVRFRTSLLLPDATGLSPAMSKGLVYANAVTVDRCLPAIAAVAAGEMGLTEALDVIGY